MLDNVTAEVIGAALLAIVALLWRHRRSLASRLGFVPGVVTRLERDQSKLREIMLSAFDTASRVDLMVIRGLAVIALKDALLHRELANKAGKNFTMRVLLLKPSSAFVSRRAAEIGETPTAVSAGITYSLNELLEAKQRHKLDLEVRLYDALPTWRMMMADDRMFLSWYVEGTDGDKTPMYIIDKTPLSVYQAFARYFNSVWNAASSPDAQNVFTADDAEKLLRIYGCADSLIFHCRTVSRVAVTIAENALATHRDLDLHVIEIGALLHDIGKARSVKMDHAVRGAQYIRGARETIVDDDFRERLARVIERHVGAGLTKDEVMQINKSQRLSIPVTDYVPETMEEIIVAVADKMVEGNHEKTFDEQLAQKVERFGEGSEVVQRLKRWQDQLKPYLK